MTHCSPCQRVFTPGSPSRLRARKPPSVAISRMNSFSLGAVAGSFFLLRMQAACYSSRSNNSSASNSGHVRPRCISRATRQEVIMYATPKPIGAGENRIKELKPWYSHEAFVNLVIAFQLDDSLASDFEEDALSITFLVATIIAVRNQ